MFLRELTTEQKRALLILARQVIAADERLALSEVELLDHLYDEAGLASEGASAPDQVGDLNYLFDTARARAVVLINLLLVAHADGRVDPKENDAIWGIAMRLRVEAPAFDRLQAWAYRYAGLMAEGLAFGTTDDLE